MQTNSVILTHEHEADDGLRTSVEARHNPIGIWNIYAPRGTLHMVLQARLPQRAEYRVSMLIDGRNVPDVDCVLDCGQRMEFACTAARQAFITIRVWNPGEPDWSEPVVIFWVVGPFERRSEEEE